MTTPATPAKATPTARKVAPKAAAPAVAKAPAKKATTKAPVRTTHTDCTHPKSGAEGKKARAACRRERAAEATKAKA